MDAEEDHVSYGMQGNDRVETARWAVQAQECSMCGDVGFPDQLHRCTRCSARYQHTYCSSSTEGLRTGTWMCDWCRLVKEESNDSKETPASRMTYSVLDNDSAGLECLLKAALSEAQYAAGSPTANVNGGTLYSHDLQSVKEEEASSSAPEAPSCSSEERMSHGDEAMSGPSPRGSPSDSKRNPKSLRCSTKISQKKRHKLVEQQCSSAQLKRLASMKTSKAELACDPPKAFVRRYKSLSDISF